MDDCDTVTAETTESQTANRATRKRSSAKPEQPRGRRNLTSKQRKAEIRQQRKRLEDAERKVAVRERKAARAARNHALVTFGAMLVSMVDKEPSWMTVDPDALLAWLSAHRDEISACATWPVPEDGDAELAGRRLRAWEAGRREADKAARIQRAAEVVAAQEEDKDNGDSDDVTVVNDCDEETLPPPEGTEGGGSTRWAVARAMDEDVEDDESLMGGVLFDPDTL